MLLIIPVFLDSTVAVGENVSRQRTTGIRWRWRCQAFPLLLVNSWAKVRSQCFSAKAVFSKSSLRTSYTVISDIDHGSWFRFSALSLLEFLVIVPHVAWIWAMYCQPIFFGISGVWTQGLTLASVLYHFSHALSPVCFNYFEDSISHRAGLRLRSFCPPLLGWTWLIGWDGVSWTFYLD
jgi:hypothetical protein